MKTKILAFLLACISTTLFSQNLTESETFDYLSKYSESMCDLRSDKTYCANYVNGSSDYCYKDQWFGQGDDYFYFRKIGDEISVFYSIYYKKYPCNTKYSTVMGHTNYHFKFKASKIKDIAYSGNGYSFNNGGAYKIVLEDYSGEIENSKTNEISMYFSNEDGRTFDKVRKAWLYLANLCKQNYKPQKDPFE